MALLTLAAEWATERDRPLHVLTVDHGLRPEAKDEAAFVSQVATQAGLPHQTLNWERPAAAQAKARDGRHRLLARGCRELGARTLLTGHTLDDQVETFFMRLAHRSGWRGLAAMSPMSVSPVWPEGRGIVIARPLMGLRRSALREMLVARDRSWIEDPSNANLAYERIQWRQRLACDSSLMTRGMALVAKFETLRRVENAQLADWLSASADPQADSSLRLNMTGAPTNLLRPALSVLLQIAAGTARQPDRARLSALVEAIASGGPSTARTMGGAWLLREGETLLIARDPGRVDRGAPEIDGVWDGRFARLPSPDAPDAPPITAHHRMTRPSMPEGDGWIALAEQRLKTLLSVLRHR